MIRSICFLTLVGAVPVRSQEPAPDAATALAVAVDLPAAADRRRAALELSKRSDVTLEGWLAAMKTFGRFEPVSAGTRRYEAELRVGNGVEQTELFVHVPDGYDPAQPAPLLLMAHGTGGSGRGQDRLWRDVSDRLGMLVVAPSEAGPNAGYAFSERERLAALAALRWARRHFNVDEDRIFASGISRGGHLVWDLALRYPDRFAAIAPMIGGPRWNLTEGQNNLRYLENVVRLPIRDLQGSKDDPRLLFNLRWAFSTLHGLGATDAKLIEFAELGHSFDPSAVDWGKLFGTARRDPRPRQVVLRAARRDGARAFWVEITKVDGKVRETFRPRVHAEEWSRLDDAGRRKLVQTQIDERTARLAVEWLGPGSFEATGKLVRSFRLLLTPDMLGGDGRVEVRFRGKRVRRKPHADAKTLLCEFVERFDRTFLPVAEVAIR